MQLQLSFEFLAYLALAFVALGVIVGAEGSWQGTLQHLSGAYSMYMLAERINSALLSSSPSAYASLGSLGMCNLTFADGVMETRYGNFSIIGDINKQSICGN